MHYALMDDGRKVVVDTATQQTRIVSDKEFFLDNLHVNVLLKGCWHTVRSSRLKKSTYGNPMGALHEQT